MRWLALRSWHGYLLAALVLWLVVLVAPSVPLYITRVGSVATFRAADDLTLAAAVGTALFGFALGRVGVASSTRVCALYGGVVRSISAAVADRIVPPGGEPIFPEPINFLLTVVINVVLIWTLLSLGALGGAGLRRWADRGDAGAAR